MPIIVSQDELDNLLYVIKALKLQCKVFQVNDENAFLHKSIDELFPPLNNPCVYIYVVKGKNVKMTITKEGLFKSYS